MAQIDSLVARLSAGLAGGRCAHRAPEERDLLLEACTGRADRKVEAQYEPLPGRQRGLFPPGHEARGVLAGNDVADGFAEHRDGGREGAVDVRANQFCSRHSRNAIRARSRTTHRLFALIVNSLQISWSRAPSPPASRTRGPYWRQPFEAEGHHVEESPLVERRLRITPFVRPPHRAAAPVEHRVEILDIHLRLDVAERRGDTGRFALILADGVDDLVLQDPGEPGAQARLPEKPLPASAASSVSCTTSSTRASSRSCRRATRSR